jgi:hypothetical protein
MIFVSWTFSAVPWHSSDKYRTVAAGLWYVNPSVDGWKVCPQMPIAAIT